MVAYVVNNGNILFPRNETVWIRRRPCNHPGSVTPVSFIIDQKCFIINSGHFSRLKPSSIDTISCFNVSSVSIVLVICNIGARRQQLLISNQILRIFTWSKYFSALTLPSRRAWQLLIALIRFERNFSALCH